MTSAADEHISDGLINRINTIKDETRAYVKMLLSFLCMNDYVNDENITLHIKGLSDGIDESDYDFEKKFVSGDIKSLSKTLSFEQLPISEKIETYQHPLVLISDENEIDKSIRNRIIRRKENGLETYPVIVFCDDFFTVREGESFGYLNIIESIEEACGDNCHAMALKISDMENDNEYVMAYVNYLDMALHLKAAKECMEETFEYIDSVIDRLRFVTDDASINALKKLAAITKIRNYLRFRDELRVKSRSLDEQIKRVDGLILEIRDEYDLHIYRIRKKEPFKTASPMAVHVDLKYGALKDQLFGFLEEVSSSSVLDNTVYLLKDTGSLVDESRKELSTNTSELTLIGTFSSGKTTIINTFLGHSHKLHTSKNHNTAVLMQIKKKPDGEQDEFFEVVYKEKLIWSIIKPAYLETKLYRNPFPGRAKVIDIKRTELGSVVRIQENSGEKRIRDIRIGRMHKLHIDKGSIVDGGASLIVADTSGEELQLASKREVRLLLDYISQKKLVHPRIRVSYRSGSREYEDKKAVGFLKKLSKCEKYNQVSKDDRHPMVSSGKLSELMGANIIYADLFADIVVDGKKIELDEKGWMDFCGTDDDALSQSRTTPFCEAPDCYMLADHLDVYLDCEFLNYCSVNDTPGFGSITEEHDACTERFVSSSKSRLLTMITINSKSEDTKLYDFLNFIANVYQNFRKDQIQEVYFMLNCFSNNTLEQKLRSDIKKVSKLIVDLGFKQDNIYVCDLRKSTEESQEMFTMWGAPSYAAFKKECIDNMLESGLAIRYSGVYKSWEKYFKDNTGYIEKRLSILEDTLENGENQIELYRKRINAVDDVRNPSINGILSEAKKKYDEFYESIRVTFTGSKKTTGILWWKKRERQEACIEIMSNIEGLISAGELEDFEYEIKNTVDRSIKELEIASDIYSDDDLEEANYVIFTLAIQSIKDKLLVADDEENFLDDVFCGSEITDRYMRTIERIIETDYKESAARAKVYFQRLFSIYANRKKQALNTLNEELKGIENPELIREQINVYRETNKEINRLKGIFEKTINTDVLRSR